MSRSYLLHRSTHCTHLVVRDVQAENVSQDDDGLVLGVIAHRCGNITVDTANLLEAACIPSESISSD
jgi:hypothetical protein